MRRIRTTRHILLGAILVAVVLGACTDDGEGGSLALGRASTTTTTTTEPPGTTTTTLAPVSTTIRPSASTTSAPVVVDGIPQVRVTPDRAAVGSRVRIEGTGFTGDPWQRPRGNVWLSLLEGPCALVADTDASVTVTADGRLSGSFTVPAEGVCRQSDLGGMALIGGRYYIDFQCLVCRIGLLTVDAPPPPPPLSSVRCNDIGFSPNSDNLASNIIATGVSCAEAEALIRKVGGPLGPVNGAPRAEADGWLCIRTSEDLRGLPTATYECRNGNRTITFVR